MIPDMTPLRSLGRDISSLSDRLELHGLNRITALGRSLERTLEGLGHMAVFPGRGSMAPTPPYRPSEPVHVHIHIIFHSEENES